LFVEVNLDLTDLGTDGEPNSDHNAVAVIGGRILIRET
jgi:hypothetical protein